LIHEEVIAGNNSQIESSAGMHGPAGNLWPQDVLVVLTGEGHDWARDSWTGSIFVQAVKLEVGPERGKE
jgi:hypothetical protein